MRLSRLSVGLLLLTLYAGVSNARWLYRAASGLTSRGHQDPVTPYEARFSELRTALPARGVVGYVGDVPPERYTSEDFRRFILTAYALAPLVVVHDRLPELVVGNFVPDSVPAVPPPGLRLVRDFGGGVWLLRRAP